MDAFASIGKNTYSIIGVNRVRWNDQLVLYTPAFGKKTNTKGIGTEVIVKGLELPIKGNNLYEGIVDQVLKDVESVEIPDDRVVLSGQGLAAEFLIPLKEETK